MSANPKAHHVVTPSVKGHLQVIPLACRYNLQFIFWSPEFGSTMLEQIPVLALNIFKHAAATALQAPNNPYNTTAWHMAL